MNKPELREVIRGRLRAAALADLAAASERICRAIEAQSSWREARLVAAFLPLAREPQIQSLWAGEEAPVFCFPQVRGAEVVLLRVDDRTLLSGADWKFGAPGFSACPMISPADLDVILVPGIAFTRAGRRLGRGGGYYDRLLAQCGARTARIGICFDCQIVDELPAEPHDQPVETVLTESSPA